MEEVETQRSRQFPLILLEILEDLVGGHIVIHQQQGDQVDLETLLQQYQDKDIQVLLHQCLIHYLQLSVVGVVVLVVKVDMLQMENHLDHLMLPEVMVDQEDLFHNFQFLLLGKQFHQKIILFGMLM